MKIRTKVKAGGVNLKHNARKATKLIVVRVKVRTGVKSGGIQLNHNPR